VRVPDPILDPVLNQEKPKPNTKPEEKHSQPNVFLPPLHAGEPGAVVRTTNSVVDEYLDHSHPKQPAESKPSPIVEEVKIPKEGPARHAVERT